MHLLDYLRIFDSALENTRNQQIRGIDKTQCRSTWLERQVRHR